MKNKKALVVLFILLLAVASVTLSACNDGKVVVNGVTFDLSATEALGATVSDNVITLDQNTEGFTPNELLSAVSVMATVGESGRRTLSTSDFSVDWGGYTGTATVGSYTVTVTYNSDGDKFSASFVIKVKEIEVIIEPEPEKVTVSSIAAVGARTEFSWGEALSYEGISVTATYSDGTTADVSASVTVASTSFNPRVSGIYSVKVTYTEDGVSAETSYNVTVGKPKIIGINISGGKTQFEYGEEFSSEGLNVNAVFQDNSKEVVTASAVIDKGLFNPNSASTYVITVSYTRDGGAYSDTYTVSVAPLKPSSISVDGMRQSFDWGEVFSSEGLTATVTYRDGSTAEVSAVVNSSAYNARLQGDYVINVAYAEASVTVRTEYTVSVAAPKLSYIAVNGGQTVFDWGTEFSDVGVTVTAVLEDGTSFNATISAVFDTSAYRAEISGKYAIGVSYLYNSVRKTDSYLVTVSHAPLTSLTLISAPDKTKYRINEDFEFDGIELAAEYRNGETATFTNANAAELQAVGFNTEEITTSKTVTFCLKAYPSVKAAYDGTEYAFTYSVTDTVKGITLLTRPTKNFYYKGDVSFDFTGFTYKIVYVGGGESAAFEYDADVFDAVLPDITSIGNKTCTLTHTESRATATFTYFVTDRVSARVSVMPKSVYAVGETVDYSDGVAEFSWDYADIAAVTVPLSELFSHATGFYSSSQTDINGRKVTFTLTDYAVLGTTYSGSFGFTYHVDAPVSISVTFGASTPETFLNAAIPVGKELFAGATITVGYSSGFSLDYLVDDLSADDFDEKFTVSNIVVSALTASATGRLSFASSSSVYCSFNYRVSDWVYGVTVTTAPDKINYYKGETLSLDGAKVTLFYKSGVASTLQDLVTAVSEGLIGTSGFSTDTLGAFYLSITRALDGTVGTSIGLNVINRVSALEISKLPDKTSYYVGDEFDISGAEIKLLHDFPVDDYTVSSAADLAEYIETEYYFFRAGQRTVIIKCASDTSIFTTFEVSVSVRQANTISFSVLPKTEYYLNEPASYSKGKLFVNFAEGEDGIIDMWDYSWSALSSGITVSGFDTSAVGAGIVVTVYYDGNGDGVNDASTTYEITVTRRLLDVTIGALPEKSAYHLGDGIDLTNGYLTLTYADNDGDVNVAMSSADVTVSGFSSLLAGIKTVTVSYADYTLTFDVTVTAPVLTSIKLAELSDVDYYGNSVVATYGNWVLDKDYAWLESFSCPHLIVVVTYDYSYPAGNIYSPYFASFSKNSGLSSSGFTVTCADYQSTSADNLADTYDVTVTHTASGKYLTYQATRAARPYAHFEFVIAESSPHATSVLLSNAYGYSADNVVVEEVFRWTDTYEVKAERAVLTLGTDYTINATAVKNAVSVGEYVVTLSILKSGYTSDTLSFDVTAYDGEVESLSWSGTLPTANVYYGYTGFADVMSGLGVTLNALDGGGNVITSYSASNSAQYINNFASVVTESAIGSTVDVTVSYVGALNASATLPVTVCTSPTMAWSVAPIRSATELTASSHFSDWASDINVRDSVILLTFADNSTTEIDIFNGSLSNNWDTVIGQTGDDIELYLYCGTSSLITLIAVDRIMPRSFVVYTEPTKTEYYSYQAIDFTGGVLRIEYNNGTYTLVSMTDDAVTVESRDGVDLTCLPSGTVYVWIVYAGEYGNCEKMLDAYEVKTEEVTSIGVADSSTHQTRFYNDEIFSAEGLTVQYTLKSSGSEVYSATEGTEYTLDSSAFSSTENGWVTITLTGVGLWESYSETYEIRRITGDGGTDVYGVTFTTSDGKHYDAFQSAEKEFVWESEFGAGTYSVECFAGNDSVTLTYSVGGLAVNPEEIVFDGTNDVEITITVTLNAISETYTAYLTNVNNPISSIVIGGEAQTLEENKTNIIYIYPFETASVTVTATAAVGYVTYINGEVLSSTVYRVKDGGLNVEARKYTETNGVVTYETVKAYYISFVCESLISSLTVNGETATYDGFFRCTLNTLTSQAVISATVPDGYTISYKYNGIPVDASGFNITLGYNYVKITLTNTVTSVITNYELIINLSKDIAFDQIRFTCASATDENGYSQVEHANEYGDYELRLNCSEATAVIHHKFVLNDGWTLINAYDVYGVALENIALTSENAITFTYDGEGRAEYTLALGYGGAEYTYKIALCIVLNDSYNGNVGSALKMMVCNLDVQSETSNDFFVVLPSGYPVGGLSVSDLVVAFNEFYSINGSDFQINVTIDEDLSVYTLIAYYIGGGSSEFAYKAYIRIVRYGEINGDVSVNVTSSDGYAATFEEDPENLGLYVGDVSLLLGGDGDVTFDKDGFAVITVDETRGDYATMFDSYGKINRENIATYAMYFTVTASNGDSRNYRLNIHIIKEILMNVYIEDNDGNETKMEYAYENNKDFSSLIMMIEENGGDGISVLHLNKYSDSAAFTDNGDNTGTLVIRLENIGYLNGTTAWVGLYSAATHSSAIQIAFGVDFAVPMTCTDGLWMACFYIYVNESKVENFRIGFISSIIGVFGGEDEPLKYVSPCAEGLNDFLTNDFVYDVDASEYVCTMTDAENKTFTRDKNGELNTSILLTAFVSDGSTVYFNSDENGTAASVFPETPCFYFGTIPYCDEAVEVTVADGVASFFLTVVDSDGLATRYRVKYVIE